MYGFIKLVTQSIRDMCCLTGMGKAKTRWLLKSVINRDGHLSFVGLKDRDHLITSNIGASINGVKIYKRFTCTARTCICLGDKFVAYTYVISVRVGLLHTQLALVAKLICGM
jgi:hypothetical protein